MKLFCTHDPHNPDHIVCHATWSVHDVILGITGFVLVVVTILVVVIRVHVARKQNPDILENSTESQQYSGQSEPYLGSEALYFSKEGEQVGRGPWPLKVGETTKLKVFWRFSPGDLGQKDIVVTAKLGSGVTWTGFVPIGNGIIYIPEERGIRWRPGDQTALVFEVAITPTAEVLVGDFLLILDKLTVVFYKSNDKTSYGVVMPNTVISPLTE